MLAVVIEGGLGIEILVEFLSRSNSGLMVSKKKAFRSEVWQVVKNKL